ncbi:MAG: hypothetical protein K2J16_07165 [Clostridia bacterium]|nr:hypothetical protein [Clostridia bacterium]
MKERFKRYLEEQFRHIAPTQAAMEYRKSMLTKMLDREHELRIKGVADDDLIYNMVIGELGDFENTLHDFENNTVKKEIVRRVSVLGTLTAVGYVFLLTLVYIIVGCVAKIWHPTWFILVGGILVGLTALSAYSSVKSVKKKWYNALRLFAAIGTVLLSTFVFLLLQVVLKLTGSWLTFLAMVAVLAGVDVTISFATKSKIKWFELPIFVELFCVMLYVILGISLSMYGINIWHPAWILCLGGFVAAICEAVLFSSGKERVKAKKTTAVDESYWTEWDD